jgi:ubiquinol-cytochrome c reductase iron-sulfur subunit
MTDTPDHANDPAPEHIEDEDATQNEEDAEQNRRSFLVNLAGGLGAVGAAAAVWPLVDSMAPSAAVLASGAPINIDLAHVASGDQKIIAWRGMPIFIVRRTTEELKILRESRDIALLSDPDSNALQQPRYAKNWHRSIKPELLVVVGICTHLGCVPRFKPGQGTVSKNWLGGYFCPCHGSKYDLSGRVYRDVPAPYNLPVPPYRFVNDTTIRIGENPKGSRFDLASIEQL